MPALIATTERSGVDKYSQEIAKRLDVDIIATGRYFSFREALSLSNRLRSIGDSIHLTNQHFGRHAFFVRKPFLITVHDLARCCFNFDRETSTERLWLKLDLAGIRRAKRIIAVSQSTKNDLIRYLKVRPDKIDVVYNGVDHSIFKPTKTDHLAQPYILYVGSERVRKNLTMLLAAFARVKARFPGLKLVKVGSEGRSRYFRQMTLSQIEHMMLNEDVTFQDHVPEDHLPGYYSSASVFVYPSLYEGFGLPPLEAMACGCPVITSNTSSLPEVVGDAAVTVDPHDVDGLAQAITEVLTNEGLRQDMIEKGLAQAKKFSWEKTAEETLKVYETMEG